MNCKPDVFVLGTVRPIAGSLLVAGALFCLGLMSVHAQTVDLESGLVAYYPFNGNANDESGNGNDGEVNGATLAEDRNGDSGKAYSFDGDDYIEVPSSDTLNIKSRTVSGWFKLNEKPTSTLALIAKVHGCTTAELAVEVNAQQLYASFEDSYNPGNDDSDVSTVNPVSIGEWVHFLHVWNEESFEHKLWINGQQVSSKIVSGKKPAWNNSSVLGIGAVLGSCGINHEFFKGLMDEVRIYNRALSEAEVAALYELEKLQPAVVPTISVQPIGATVIAGSSTSFSVTATGTWPITYQWKHNGQDLDGQLIAGAATSNLLLENVDASDAGSYTVVVSNEAGSVTSDAAVLTVDANTPLTYLVEGNSVTVTDCDESASGALVIPSSYNGKPVTAIGDNAFQNCESLTNVTIPDSVTSIGGMAFNYCRGLTNLTIPDNVTSIGGGAFAACSSLTSVTIPDSITSIGGWAFSYCSSLTNIEAGKGNAKYTTEDGVLFDKNKTVLIQFPAGKSGHYTIPGSVTDIISWAFAGCSSLTSVTIPDSVASIWHRAFYGCSSLTTVTIPNPNAVIDDDAFDESVEIIRSYYEAPLTYLVEGNSVTITDCETSASGALLIPSSYNGKPVTAIGDLAFDGCTNLTSVTIPESVTSIGMWAFTQLDSLTHLTIPDSVITIGHGAFESCDNLSSVEIGKSVNTISSFAFAWCNNLKSVTIPNSVNSIGEAAFGGCRSLIRIEVSSGNSMYISENGIVFNADKTTLVAFPASKSGEFTIPDTVTTIGAGAFHDCKNLTGVIIPETVITIGQRAFASCSFTSLKIPNSVTSIGMWAFSQLDSLAHLTIPDSVITIGHGAFESCDNLTSVEIGKSVNAIGSYAFAWCRSLNSVTIPESVTSIGDQAFLDCSSLKTVTIPNPKCQVDENAFDEGVEITRSYYDAPLTYLVEGDGVTVTNCDEDYAGELVIPDSFKGKPVTKIGESAFRERTDLESVTISDSIIIIGDSAFKECRNLRKLTIGNSVQSIGRGAFYNCKRLLSLKIPDSVLIIEEGAFHRSYGLRSLTIGSSVKTIGRWAFAGSGITNVTIPKSVSKIERGAFAASDNFTQFIVSPENTSYVSDDGVLFDINKTTLVQCPGGKAGQYAIPENVSEIGPAAFYGCKILTSVTIPHSIISIGTEAFGECISLTSVSIPNGVKTIEPYAFMECTSLTIVLIGNSVTQIGGWAFSGCSRPDERDDSRQCHQHWALCLHRNKVN